MREKIFLSVLFLTIFISFNLTAQAYDPSYPGSFSNPLQMQIIPDPVRQLEIQQLQQQLKMQQEYQQYDQHQTLLQQAYQNWENASNKVLSMPYIAACSYTYTSVHSKFSEMLKDNMADLFTIRTDTSYLNILYSTYQKCVSEVAQATQTQNKVTCSTGTTLVGNTCVVVPVTTTQTNDKTCVDKFGAHSKLDGTKTSEGLLNCGCEDGYQSNSGATACVLISQSIIKCNGKEWNSCPIGQKFYCPSTGDAQCVPIPKTAPIKPITKKLPEIKTGSTNTPNLTSINSDTRVVISTEPVKPKKPWTKFIGWLGF